MHYVDGFVIPVPRDRLEEYRAIARRGAEVWMEYGALQYFECVGDDVPPGTLTSFPRAVQARDDEVVIFAWIVYASRAERDRINALVMADPRIADYKPEDMPFDGRRMFWGGFESLVEAGWGTTG
jgi:uncharacterized protein YbaA (DUF1428 family)